MRPIAIRAVLLGLLLALGLPGCATWWGGEETRPDKAMIYIYRESGGVNGPYPKFVFVDGRSIGKLISGGYFVVTAAPGEHVISTPAANPAAVTLAVEKGKAYYVSQEVIPTPPRFHVLLNRVNEKLGRQAVGRARRLF